VDIGAPKIIARYRTLKRDLPECRQIERPAPHSYSFIT
jgi:hypothetical protein